MKQFGVILAAMLFAIPLAFADGTKQFMPYDKTVNGVMQGKGITYLSIAAQEGGSGPSRPFARYNHTGDQESCEEPHRLHIRIIDHENEEIHFGFGKEIKGEGPTYGGTLYFRIKNPRGEIVWDAQELPNSGDGFIESYAEAYYGPKSINSEKGYDCLKLDPDMDGDYYIEFDNGSNIGSTTGNTPISLELFDITVVKDGKAENGRVWSRAWGLNTNGAKHETYTTFYTMSTDHYLSKVYMGGFQPYQFVIACNSYGSINTKNCEEDRKSLYTTDVPFNQIPEYQVFLTKPDPAYWGTAKIPNVPDKLTFAGDAMTCEDLIFVVQLLYNENATLELYLDTDGDNTPDKVIASLLEATVLRDRGFHYPWKAWTELKEAGQGKYFYTPAADGCARLYTLSLFNQSFIYDCPEYTILDGGGRSHTATVDTANPGDSLRIAYTKGFDTETGKYDFDNSKYRLQYPIGSEQNPILISSAKDLENLLSATNTSEERSYHVKYENYYHYYYHDGNEIKHQWGDFETDIPNTNGFEGVYFYIIAPSESIVLEDNPEKEWTWDGIGTAEHPFKGHIRAGKYAPDPTVNKNTPTPDDDPEPLPAGSHQNTIILNGTSNGLFGYCEGATIENIHVKGSITEAKGTTNDNTWFGVGGICDYAQNTKFSHCTNACKIEIDEYCESTCTGGIVGYGENIIVDSCSNYGVINTIAPTWGKGNYSGGIVGMVWGTTSTINFCYNVSNVKNKGYTGGIVGGSMGATVSNCKNAGYVEATPAPSGLSGTATYGGGIAGYQMSNTNVISCLNSGTVTADYCAGICYTEPDLTISYCMNEGGLYGEIDECAITGSGNDNTHIISSISTNNPAQYINGSDTTEITSENKASIYATIESIDASPFYVDENSGDLKMSNIECCGRVFRQEDAGRLFKSNTTFYIKWDGKNSEGDCVTGDVTVSYQKNSGVTHFPFYDPENNKEQGLVVYRLSPIQDSILNASPLVESGSYANKYGYQRLPKNYFQETNYDETEMGIELKLFWDDTNLSKGSKCANDGEINGYLFGESATIPATYKEYHAFTSKKDAQKNCLNGAYSSTTSGWTRYYICENLKPGGKSSYKLNVQTSSGSSACLGISNLGSSSVWDKEPNASKADRLGGYYGSQAGGHLFPITDFGNKNIMNTWWNGVEVKQLVPLKLYENSPAILMPIELTLWTATNLEESVLLEWTTASEENNDYFAIERSTNGVTWNVLGNVGGAGTTSATHYYSFEDTKPVSGISYYRLKQVDFNGEYTYSSVKCINRPANADKMYKAYVNQDIDAFIVQGEEIAACNIEVYNNLGIKMTNLSFNPISTDKVVINVGQLPIGTYFIKICNGSKSVVKSW